MLEDRYRRLALLLEEIRAEAQATANYTGRAAFSERVMQALADVPRDEFVAPKLGHSAWANRPLPIGLGQTISQPYIVALMTDLIDPEPGDVVLEVGTGSGYQAAILARLVKQVYSVECLPELAADARTRLARLGCDNVEVRCGDGRLGWPEHAPYDAILVAAAPEAVPHALVRQLKPGGTMVIPVGPRHGAQDLLRIHVDPDGHVARRSVLPVAFVPLVGDEAAGGV
jgi:protein-L-isoaspartate(D-aspartate) O-methyltransferase